MLRVFGFLAGMFFLTALLFSGCSRTEGGQALSGGMITIKGSDTMVHMVSNWAEQYMARHPGIQISVTGGGSGTGIAALLNKTTDIAAVSRPMKDKELAQAQKNGITPHEYSVANDGIVLVVNPDNPVNEITMAQLKKLYTGEITNWRDVGGPNAPVLLFSRESSSGTYGFFQEHVLEGGDFHEKTRLMPATSAIVESVAVDVAGIGYVGLGYAENAGDRVKIIAIKPSDDAPAIMPTSKTILSGEYPIARALHFYTAEQPPAAVGEFLDYVLGSEGQKVAEESGYVPIRTVGKAL